MINPNCVRLHGGPLDDKEVVVSAGHRSCVSRTWPPLPKPLWYLATGGAALHAAPPSHMADVWSDGTQKGIG